MKKLIALLILVFIAPTPVHAATVLQVTEKSHRTIEGKFIDDELATLIAPTGRLGEMVYNRPNGVRVWQIDAALIDDVQKMAEGYELVDGKAGVGKDLAKQWLVRLRSASAYDEKFAIPYGNPSQYWVDKLARNSKSYFLSLSADRLSKFYGYSIKPLESYTSTTKIRLSDFQVNSYKELSKAIQATRKYMDPILSETLQLRSVSLFNGGYTSKERDLLAKDLGENTFELLRKIRLAPGRFTLSSSKQNLPVTVINDFPNPATLTLQIGATNTRITTPDQILVKLDGKSRIQVKIPVEVLTSGDTGLTVGISNEQRKKLGDSVIYPITSRVINPTATWITYIAAIILFISAVVQSVRRIRKRER